MTHDSTFIPSDEGHLSDGRIARHQPGRKNAALIAQCARLGYVTERVADLTYGNGAFWKRLDIEVDGYDIKPKVAGVEPFDFTVDRLPRNYATIVADVPFKLTGTPWDTGGIDERYGVDRYRPKGEVEALFWAAMACASEALEPDGQMLVKCMDQVCGGHLRRQSRWVDDIADTLGLTIVDYALVDSYRPQDPARVQQHFASNYSTLIVLRRS